MTVSAVQSPRVPLVRPPRYRKLSVLMPVYNEARTLRTIVARVLHAPVTLPLELVIVDDGSTDGSRQLIAALAASESRIRAVYHAANQGKGAAVRTAIQQMTGDLALIQDADLEYDPADYPRLLGPMLEGTADAVFGSRFLEGAPRYGLSLWQWLANRFLTQVCNRLNGLSLTDMESGYKLLRADVLRQLPLQAKCFAIEPELTTRLAQSQLRLCEVPISYTGRTYAEGKKIRGRDAVKALWAMFRYRFLSPRANGLAWSNRSEMALHTNPKRERGAGRNPRLRFGLVWSAISDLLESSLACRHALAGVSPNARRQATRPRVGRGQIEQS